MASIVKYLSPADGSDDDPRFAGKIRVTDDGKISIIDAIKCVLFANPDGTLKTNAHQMASHAFSRLEKEHEEVCTFRSHWKFPGARQRDTPVTDRQGLTRIFMLLPGKVAAKFREQVSVLLERYLNADQTLAEDILRRADVEDTGGAVANVEDHPRVKSSLAAKELGAAIKAYMDSHTGCGMLYPIVHDTNNLTVTGKSAAQLRAFYNASGSSRDLSSKVQNTAMLFLQTVETHDMSKTGDHPVAVAKRCREWLEPGFRAAGLHDAVADRECIRDNAKVMRLAQKANREALVARR